SVPAGQSFNLSISTNDNALFIQSTGGAASFTDTPTSELTQVSLDSYQALFVDASTGVDIDLYGRVQGGTGVLAVNRANGPIDITINDNGTAGPEAHGSISYGIFAQQIADGGISITTEAGTEVLGSSRGISAQSGGENTIKTHGNVEGTGDGFVSAIYVVNGTINVTTYGLVKAQATNGRGIQTQTSDGDTNITTHGEVDSGNFGINASASDGGGKITVNIEAGSRVTGATRGIRIANYVDSRVPAEINVAAGSSVTSDGIAFYVVNGPIHLNVAGVIDGDNAAVQLDDSSNFDSRVELHPTASITGNVVASPGSGPGEDTLAFGGTGNGEFDLTRIATPAMPAQQFQNFDKFEVASGTWNLIGETTVPFAVVGGTLEGTATFGGLTVTGGTLAPGNSIGTMIVNGALALGGGAVFEVEVDAAGNNDKVIVNGTVNLTGATLKVIAANGNYNPKTDYTIIDNNGTDAVVGTFGSVSTNLAFLTPEVNYAAGDGNDVVLTLLRNTTLFPDVAQTKNQKAVAGALSRFPTDNPLYLAILEQTAAGARQAFDALSGELHATVAGTLVDDSRYAREAVLGRMMQASHVNGALGSNGPQVASHNDGAMRLGGKFVGEEVAAASVRQPLAFWTEGYGAWGTFDGDGNAATADRNLGGFISGIDADVWNGWRVGLATGASFSDVSVDQRYSGANTQTYHLGGYVNGDVSGFALRGGGLWAWTEVETSRAVVFPGFYERQKADYDADTGQLFGEVAYPTQVAGIELEPFGGFAYVSVETGGFREKGGAQASLRTGGFDQDVGYTTVGLRAAHRMMWGAMAVTPHVEAAWLHAFDDVTPGASLAFATTGIGFAIDGVPLAEDSAILDAGLDFAVSERLTAGVSYTGQWADSISDNGVKGRLTWLFN
ncbi:MAG: autotransporter domain-containing protein, partial [Methyloceanibacter sp.]|nr:autotransporter domain-containing protein [Methyloceanibacter sp.]